MRVWAVSLVGILTLALVGTLLMMRSHRAWLDRQSPVGLWRTSGPAGEEIFLQFDGGPQQGTYRQLTRWADRTEQELGHCTVSQSELRLLVVASDRSPHPLFGEDTQYERRYTGPQAISIRGPERSDLTFERAPEGTVIGIQGLEQCAP